MSFVLEMTKYLWFHAELFLRSSDVHIWKVSELCLPSVSKKKKQDKPNEATFNQIIDVLKLSFPQVKLLHNPLPVGPCMVILWILYWNIHIIVIIA